MKTKAKRGRGRPVGRVYTAHVGLMLAPKVKRQLDILARAAGLPVSTWIRAHLETFLADREAPQGDAREERDR